jgi:two-component system, sensor histidine kinase and response regulator
MISIPHHLLPRRLWISAAIFLCALSYFPVLAWPEYPLRILLPLVFTSACFMLSARHQSTLVVASLCLTALAMGIEYGLVRNFIRVELDGAHAALSSVQNYEVLHVYGALALAQLTVGLAQLSVIHSPWGYGRAQRRLRGRLQRQSQQLQAVQSSEKLTAQQFESDRRTLLEHLPVHVVQKDCHGRFTFVTQSFCDLVQRDYAEIIGRTDADLFPADAAEKFIEDDRHVIETGRVFDDVERTQLPDGTLSYMQVRKAPLRDRDGSILGVQGIFWDVTEEHIGRKELQRIEALAHALIHAALDAVLIVDPKGRVLEANPASEKILGYTQEQVADHPSLETIMQTTLEEPGQRRIDSVEKAEVFKRKVPIVSILQSATGKRIEAQLRRSDGVWFDAEVSAHPLSFEGSDGWAMFVRDITRRKRAETELRSAKDLAERANAAKSEFVANVSHELRTPLTGIIGLHELLQRSDIDDRQQNYLQLAQVSTSNLLNLIDDLLDFSKIEAGRIEIEEVSFSLIDCIEEAAASIAARAQLRGLELMVDLAEDLPAIVLGDPHRIKQVLLNLLGNAIKFTDKGEILVRVALQWHSELSTEAKQQVFRFEVHDSGIGVPIEQRVLIFDAFRQADSSTTRRYGGTGLGLTICRDLVEMMRGTVGIVDSSLGSDAGNRGSCFYFELPLLAVEASEKSLGSNAARREEVVLVASRTPWRDILQRQLESLGYRLTILSVQQLSDRRPARLFSAGNCSIVIADYRELNSQTLATTPVVVRWILLAPLANSQPTTVPEWLKHADVKWLARPIRRSQLLEALETKTANDSEHQDSPVVELRSASVLLVEDSPVSQTVLKDMLESLGHQVKLANNGKEAIALCGEQRFDLVLMDIQMPEVDGLSATQTIRQHEKPPHRQVILALTAHASSEDRELCVAAGMDGFLVKPITLSDLQLAIATATESDLSQSLSDSGKPFAAIGQSSDRPLKIAVDRSQTADNASTNFLNDAPDWHGLVALMNGNEKLLRDVLQLLSSELPRLARLFETSVSARNFKDARRAVHTMKSNVRHVGLDRVAAVTEQLEEVARDESYEQLQLAIGQVHEIATTISTWADEVAKNH